MKIDNDKLLNVAEHMSSIPVNANEQIDVTIGKANGVVFRLVAMGRTLAKTEGCLDGPEWADCIVDA